MERKRSPQLSVSGQNEAPSQSAAWTIDAEHLLGRTGFRQLKIENWNDDRPGRLKLQNCGQEQHASAGDQPQQPIVNEQGMFFRGERMLRMRARNEFRFGDWPLSQLPIDHGRLGSRAAGGSASLSVSVSLSEPASLSLSMPFVRSRSLRSHSICRCRGTVWGSNRRARSWLAIA